MSERERLVQFELFDKNFSFYTEESEENMEKILTLLRDVVDGDYPSGAGGISLTQTGVLGCLKLAARYVRLENEFNEYKKASTERLTQLSEDIFRSLEN